MVPYFIMGRRGGNILVNNKFMFYKEHEKSRRLYSNYINKYDCGGRITERDILLEVLSTKGNKHAPYQESMR
jgi:hypothetical protein